LHGPVRLPKLYDGATRLLHVQLESYKQLVGTTSILSTSLAARAGRRSLPIVQHYRPGLKVTDALNKNAQFPGNVIPVSRFHPSAVKLLAYYPPPNRADRRNNYITAQNDDDAWDSFIIKVDHRFNESNSMSYRYQIRFNKHLGALLPQHPRRLSATR